MCDTSRDVFPHPVSVPLPQSVTSLQGPGLGSLPSCSGKATAPAAEEGSLSPASQCFGDSVSGPLLLLSSQGNGGCHGGRARLRDPSSPSPLSGRSLGGRGSVTVLRASFPSRPTASSTPWNSPRLSSLRAFHIALS